MKINLAIVAYILLCIGIITVRGHQPNDPLTYKGVLSAAEHEEAEGIYNLVEGSSPVLTIVVPQEWKRLELHPFIGKRIMITIQEGGVLQVITKDHPQ